MATTFSQVLSDADIAYLLSLPEVQAAKIAVAAKEAGSVSFTIALTPTLKAAIEERLALDLSGVTSIPMRWIKGDSSPHVDTGVRTFSDTYLMYLTDSVGEFVVNGSSYPITQGTAYRFHEGIQHETVGTGDEPRLLLGPMSERGFAVGANPCDSGTRIEVPAGTTIYIRQGSAPGNNQYSTSINTVWSPITAYPICITNQNPAGDFVKVLFSTDITLNATNNKYFICSSGKIQFGSGTLNPNGTRPTINILGITYYPGLISNYSNSDIRIFNLNINTDSSIADEAGWFGQRGFGSYGANNNYIINCATNGNLAETAGGIVGRYTGSNGGRLWIIGCSNSGEINGDNAGGIVGNLAGRDNGRVTVISCWSTGAISGDAAGGIAGSYCDNITIENCYSKGMITGYYSGGIIGAGPGDSGMSIITGCYSEGIIQGERSGGIVGGFSIFSQYRNLTLIISNCYSVGNNSISNNGAGGIIGEVSGTIKWDITINNCYAAGLTIDNNGYIVGNSTTVNGRIESGSQVITCSTNYSEAANASSGWKKSNAYDILSGVPPLVVGTTWVETVANQPYELFLMGYTPYAPTNIYAAVSGPVLIRGTADTIDAGDRTASAIINNCLANYQILEITGGDPASYGTITINACTGVISTTASTASGTYTLYLRNTGSYNITLFDLTVRGGGASTCCVDPQQLIGLDNTTRTELLAGKIMTLRRPQLPMSYADLMLMRRAQASRR